jgi:hypothetical protein
MRIRPVVSFKCEDWKVWRICLRTALAHTVITWCLGTGEKYICLCLTRVPEYFASLTMYSGQRAQGTELHTRNNMVVISWTVLQRGYFSLDNSEVDLC